MMRWGGILLVTLLAACGLQLPETTGPSAFDGDTIATRSTTYTPLADIPPRPSRVTVAVYDIPDKTGANLRTENYAEFSKAVTQGADALVLQALSEVGGGTWFQIVEREAIETILQERRMAMSQIEDLRQRQHVAESAALTASASQQIEQQVDAYRAQLLTDYQNATPEQLAQMPPLEQALADLERYAEGERAAIPRPLPYDRFQLSTPLPEMHIADYLVTGAIVAHDSDTVSGGSGLRFQNVGVLQRVQKDVITVNLRLVRVSNGEVLATSTTSQTVLSKKQQGDILNYVTLNQILEFESGVVTNEPRSLALNAALRLALSEIIVQMEGNW